MTLELIESSAQNERYLHRLSDGNAVEAVLYRGDTLCLSTQVGCAVACPFCASGQSGLLRALSLDEMCFPITFFQSSHDLARVTLSGVGEPLHNRAALDVLSFTRERGLGLSLTTSGGPLHRLEEWMHATHRGLTISVHAGHEKVRARLVPNGPLLASLFARLANVLPTLSARRRKKTALAYLVVANENDRDDEVDAFAARVLALPHPLAVHLYALNEVPAAGFRAVPRARYEAIYERLRDAGLRVRMSSTARREVNGGCGTLVAARRLVDRAF